MQGVLLGGAVGCAVGQVLGVYRPLSGFVAGILVVLLVVTGVVGRRPRGGRPVVAARRARVEPTVGTGPTAPGGFFAGRRLGDALAWLATEHAVSVLEQIAVTEDVVTVLAPGPQGPRLAAVAEQSGGFTVDFADAPPGVDDPFAGSGRFQARDVAPDVLARVLDRARREHPVTWTAVAGAEAVVLRPDRLRDEVTVQLRNGAASGAGQVLWASAAGEVLYVQETLS